MLSRLFTKFEISFQTSIKKISFCIPKLARYTRTSLIDRLYRQKEVFKSLENYSDSIALRPPSHLIKVFSFTIASGITIFYTAAYFDAKKLLIENQRGFKPESLFADFQKILNKVEYYFDRINADNPRLFNESLSPGKKCVLIIIALNILVNLSWKYKPAKPLMWRYFTNSFASKSLCLPMLLSVYSHKSFLHLTLNIYVLWSFVPITINEFLGFEQFLAVYSTSGIVSSLVGLIHKSITGSSIRSLGASGAILAVLMYALMKMPDLRLSFIFLPMFTFSAEHAVYGIILFDLIGLLLGFRLLDHAAHLGGTLFGLLYAKYGEKIYCRDLRPAIMNFINDRNNNKKKQLD